MELQQLINELTLHEINTYCTFCQQLSCAPTGDYRVCRSAARLRCGAHTFNLVIRKNFKRFLPHQNANTVLLNALKEKFFLDFLMFVGTAGLTE